MAFEMGYAANEFELQQKLDSFILSISGWEKRAQIDTFDAVYFSSGEDGFKDIYIRSRAGTVEDTRRYGGTQKDFGDGYSGYLNFFAYQYFPENGDGYDGYGEAGKYGPALYWMVGQSPDVLLFNRIGTDNNWTLINRIDNLNPLGEPPYPNTTGYQAYLLQDSEADFDGKRYWYYLTNYNGLLRFDMARETMEILVQVWEGLDDYFAGLQHWIDPRNRKEYVWFMKDSIGGSSSVVQASRLLRWNVSEGVSEYGFSGPTWSGFMASGDLITDGHDNLYCAQGHNYTSWQKYHIPTDTWTDLIALPVAFSRNDGMVFLDKKTSGFSYHRIYWVSDNNNTIYYIDIDENSGMPVGGWTSAGSAPQGVAQGANIFHNFNNRFYYHPGYSASTLYYAPIDSGALSWTLHASSYLLPGEYVRNSTFAYVDEYQSRVRTSLYDRTQYWFMGSKDRITVVTKSDDEYTFCYMGALKPYTLNTPFAITTSDVSAGSSVVVPLNIIRGEFSVGQQLFISDVTDEGGIEYTGDLENITRKYKATEVFTISDVDPGVSITISSLNNDYPAGSKIAYDPQPIGITLDGIDKIQMLNCINTVNDTGSIDMAENMAKLQTVNEDIVNASGNDDRRNNYALWPILAVNGGTDAGSSGTEARGSLVGVFAVSSTGYLSSGDTITVGTNTYMIFDVPTGAEFTYAFGPINE